MNTITIVSATYVCFDLLFAGNDPSVKQTKHLLNQHFKRKQNE